MQFRSLLSVTAIGLLVGCSSGASSDTEALPEGAIATSLDKPIMLTSIKLHEDGTRETVNRMISKAEFDTIISIRAKRAAANTPEERAAVEEEVGKSTAALVQDDCTHNYDLMMFQDFGPGYECDTSNGGQFLCVAGAGTADLSTFPRYVMQCVHRNKYNVCDQIALVNVGNWKERVASYMPGIAGNWFSNNGSFYDDNCSYPYSCPFKENFTVSNPQVCHTSGSWARGADRVCLGSNC